MCPACIASAAVMAAGAGSTGGILAMCVGKFRKFFRLDVTCREKRGAGLREGSKRDSLYLDRGGRFGENVARGGRLP